MQITTPDIGVDKATVAEILVKVGDTIAVDESIVLLESDKASVEVPSTSAGVVKSILINQGDEVSEGIVLIELQAEDDAGTVESQEADAADKTSEIPQLNCLMRKSCRKWRHISPKPLVKMNSPLNRLLHLL